MRIKIKVNSGLVSFRTVRGGVSTAALDLPGGDFEYELSGDFEVESVERYVEVRLIHDSLNYRAWSYIDPWGDLTEGDFVRVPFGYGTRSGRVEAVDTALPLHLSPLQVKTIKSRARFEDA